MLRFKKGPFASLLPIQPYITNPHSNNISVSLNYSFFITAHSLPIIPFSDMIFGNGKTLDIDLLPVFEPNEFFWKNHQKKDEKQVDTYMRVLREIMLENSVLKDGSEFSDIDRFKFIAAVAGTDQLKEM